MRDDAAFPWPSPRNLCLQSWPVPPGLWSPPPHPPTHDDDGPGGVSGEMPAYQPNTHRQLPASARPRGTFGHQWHALRPRRAAPRRG